MRSNPGTPTLNTMERPLSTDTKSAIRGTRMSEAATPAVAAGNRVSTTRIVGGAGVALAASVVVQNAVFFVGTEAPTYAAPLGEVLAYHAENRGVVAVSVGLEAVKLPLLLLFVTGLHGLVQRRGGAGADGWRLAGAGGGADSGGAAPGRRRGGLVAARGGSRSDALGGIRPLSDHAHRGRARRGWPGRADPRLRAGLAAPCRGLRARPARPPAG